MLNGLDPDYTCSSALIDCSFIAKIMLSTDLLGYKKM